MTQAEWLVSDDPVAMLRWLTDTDVTPDAVDVRVGRACPSDRLLRLFACACFRLNADVPGNTLRADQLSFAAACEAWADGDQPPPREGRHGDYVVRMDDAASAAMAMVGSVQPGRWRSIGLLRDVVGDPFAPPPGDATVAGMYVCEKCAWRGAPGGPRKCPACGRDHVRKLRERDGWLTPTVVTLAQAAYDERLADGTLDPARLAVLADALEEAGCDSQTLLRHLRGAGPHVRGCWAVDLVLGKH